MKFLADLLTERLQASSGFDERRPYIGMSKAGDCPRRIYFEFVNGVTATPDSHMGAWLGYTMEAAVLKLLGNDVLPGFELTAFDGLVRGHTDGKWRGELLEIKSLTCRKVEEIRDTHTVPDRNYWQVQTYMKFGGFTRAQIIYVPRDYGQPLVVPLRYCEGDGCRMERKFGNIVAAVKARRAPKCECRRCPIEQPQPQTGVSNADC